MIRHLLLPATLLLAACPTPPDATEPQGGQPGPPPGQGPATGGAAPPPATPPAEGGNPPAEGGTPTGGAATADGGPPDQPPISGYMKFEVDVPAEGPPKMTQDKIAAGDHVTVSGTVVCDDCEGALYLRVNKPIASMPTLPEGETLEQGGGPLVGPVTLKAIDGPGAFSLVVPKGSEEIIVELLVDVDGNGMPSRGDRMDNHRTASPGTTLTADADISGLKLDGTDREWVAPQGGPPAGGAAPPLPAPGAGTEGAPAEGG